MFVRPFTLILAITASVIATGDTVNQCNNGQIQCCDQTMSAEDAQNVPGLLGLGLPISGLIGLDCDPILNLPIGSAADCTNQAVCCTDSQFSGPSVRVLIDPLAARDTFGAVMEPDATDGVYVCQLIGINCSPINLGL